MQEERLKTNNIEGVAKRMKKIITLMNEVIL